MENIFLESYDVFKIYPNNSGKVYTDFLENNRRYSITRCYYNIVIDNVFLTYSHLMLYEECLYILYSQNKLKNMDFSFSIKKSELAKKFKTDITKSATETIKRLHELEQVKISIFVKDKIEKSLNIISHISTKESEKYSDIPDEITITLNQEFVKLYRCNYLDKIEYLNSFEAEQGSFIRYFIQHELDGGVKSSAILDKMGVFDYIPFSRKKRFEQEIASLEFYYKNEKYCVKDGFVVVEGESSSSSGNQNAAIELYKIIYAQISEKCDRRIVLDDLILEPYYNRFGRFESANTLSKILNDMELMLNQSLQQDSGDTTYFSHFFEGVVCKKNENFKAFLELNQKGFEYMLSRRANLDFWNVESADYGLTPYPSGNACGI
ncbi:hypothetical protein [Campylobacter gastrosuis]|uniref:Replication initiation protein n=1 Tax=Campylobacter gastrosuis TaxID=2974576 RepID=A0ABT7HSH4_9BACT|nr:hypothetical protein [Campylobacter gastrosuis]MDL0089820.1 hypothetical protein [Campylobacter gastrosuis]MDL0089834.1 hypothetical protein [Campylobacter gastrosuis]